MIIGYEEIKDLFGDWVYGVNGEVEVKDNCKFLSLDVWENGSIVVKKKLVGGNDDLFNFKYIEL